jgi:MFS superfamily sulfate permease-like transporter
MPAGGGTSQTAVNRLAGARSQGAELVTAAGTLATLLLLAPNDEVDAAGGARGGRHLVLARADPAPGSSLRSGGSGRRSSAGRSLQLAGVTLLGTLQGIVVAVIDSLLSLANQAYNPPLYAVARKRGTAVFRPISPEHPNDESWPGLLLLKIEGRLFFANAQRVAGPNRSEQQRTRAQVLVIDCSAVIDVEYTALKVLEQLDDKLRRNGCELWFAGMTRGVFEVSRKVGHRLADRPRAHVPEPAVGRRSLRTESGISMKRSNTEQQNRERQAPHQA